jgi:protein-tyrosine phosphatase
MLPFADTHVHLLAGRDDGPRTQDEALAMARLLVAEGCRYATALAHQNPAWPDNTPQQLLAATQLFQDALKAEQIPLSVYPTAEVMLTPDTLQDWKAGRLLSYGNYRKHLLIEMPGSMFIDIRGLAAELQNDGIRIVLAHAERYEELLEDFTLVEQTVRAGVLLQISNGELAEPSSAKHERAIKLWASRGMVHVLGSDGHQIGWRKPLYRAGYQRLAKWIGESAADRVAGIWGPALLQGLPVDPPKYVPQPKSWWQRWLGV